MSENTAFYRLKDLDQNTNMSLLGSSSWFGADAHNIADEVGSGLHERATSFLATVKWDTLTSLASSLRNGIPCRTEKTFSVGHYNMVKHIGFEDGINWVARLRLPTLKAVFHRHELLDVVSILKIEIVSMKIHQAGYIRVT